MTANIGIESVNNMAFNSVNKLTSTIRSTLQKGNIFVRAENRKQNSSQGDTLNLPRISSQLEPTSEDINALQLFNKVKPYAQKQQKIKVNIINILNFAEIKWKEFSSLQNKLGHHFHQYLEKFKVLILQRKKIQFKLNANLNQIAQQDNIQQIHAIKTHFKRIIQYLNQRARKHVDKSKQISNLIRKKDKEEFQEQCQQEAIKQEMLQLLDRLKGQAINMGSDLKKDNLVITQIHQKQDKQLNVLSSKSKGLQDMISKQKLGFFKLLSYAGRGIVVWLFTLLFILIF